MPDVGTSAMERVPNMPETEASETYPELRERLHDCMTFDVPAGVSANASLKESTDPYRFIVATSRMAAHDSNNSRKK
jgi:hypothetical protein